MRKITNSERNLLYILLEHPINRYLMSVIRLDGMEKSSVHIYMCRIMIAYYLEVELNKVSVIHPLFDELHEGTRELTDYLDETIGLPLDGSRPDYDKLVPLFFDKFINLSMKVLNEAKQ